MKLLWIAAICVTAAAWAYGDDKKDDGRFAPGPASSYSSKQTNDNITIAAVPYDTEELAHKAFGKVNPYQHGVLPVLVIIQNDTSEALRLDHLQLEYEGLHGDRVENTPAGDVQYIGSSPRQPRPNMGSPIPTGVFKKKNPLAEYEITGRAFSVKMLPPHESANGFFYFQAQSTPGAKLYLTGVTVASNGKGILYFEIPLTTDARP
jgi:hypothetical protein